MNQELGLRILSQIMGWDDGHARQEFEWLRLMARFKYDGYRDFLAGVRFIESLVAWLQQFAPEDRETAYKIVRKLLIYVGPSEIQHLVELFYPRFVEGRLLTSIAEKLRVPRYSIWILPAAHEEFKRLKRRTLFMALSEGARFDTLRHTNVNVLTNEQLVVATQVDTDKWEDLLENLHNELGDPQAKFANVFLVDDFMGTGTSFLRYNEKKKKWSGKLIRFFDSVKNAASALSGSSPLEDNYTLYVHHYITSHKAAIDIKKRLNQAKEDCSKIYCFPDVHFSFGLTLSSDFPINADPLKNLDLIALTKKYYDPILRTKHTDVGGVTHLGCGYGGCALPLVLEHNTPNNSIALLWAETDGGLREGDVVAPPMRPLFRRRQRHL
jgi:hypothetical protein